VFKSAKARLAIALTAGAVSVGAIAAPAASAQPVVTGGLVNVTITDVLSQDQINAQIPIGVAANVCGVQANVLAQGNFQSPVDCTAHNTAELPVAFR
jgi:hypothetical protein